jgi:hypothetical protein
MQNITTTISDVDLTNLGRAMERSGHTNVQDFIKWAFMEKVTAILADK